MTREEFRQEVRDLGVRNWCSDNGRWEFLYEELELEDWDGIQDWYSSEAQELVSSEGWQRFLEIADNWIRDLDYSDDMFAFDPSENNWYVYEFSVEDYERLEDWLGDDYFDIEIEEVEEKCVERSALNPVYEKLMADRQSVASVPEMELFQII